MTEKSENCKISLSSSKAISSVAYTLKIPNFFTLPEYDDTDFKVDSPSFEFADGTWCFRFMDEKWKNRKEFAVYMVRLNSEISEKKILHHIMLLDADNDIYDGDGDVFCFAENKLFEEALFMWRFSNDKRSCDMRDSLTLKIHLLYIEPSKVDDDHISVTTDSGKQILNILFVCVLNVISEKHNLYLTKGLFSKVKSYIKIPKRFFIYYLLFQ